MQCAIVGGGAAGLFAACALARGGAKVFVLERQPRVGKKLLATGGGRCNLINLRAEPARYHGARDFASPILAAYPPARIIRAFEDMGVPVYADAEGRGYPASNLASSVLDALRLTLREAGGVELTGFDAMQIENTQGGYLVRARDGREQACEKLLIASGGRAAPKLGGCVEGYALLRALGHDVTPLLPVIAPLKTHTEPIRGLKGQRARCVITLYDGNSPVQTERGEALFTEYGLSGICAMQLARAVHAAKKPVVSIDFAPDAQHAMIENRARMLPNRPLEDFLNGVVSRRVGWAIARMAGIADLACPAGTLSPIEINALEGALRAFRLPVIGVCGFESAQTTAGGADMREFHPSTLESRKRPGLYVAGEVCDVDGDCGGYNLGWAWASALAAAHAMLKVRMI
ncbi:MAG: aminoacetone oxidase family FAD-binding enzyme [Christensenellales bacterium]|jgi:predicted Rossmann fold flavoprotein